ncbi:hypothetical protein MiSe_07390 [Microseira wollei NIES-4236]|uniref:Transposase n=1 Tax=Microseira wollei NIES-4236 TaxID=2530354 RepID=A0AAV3X445_9CYAN|nr:hypothetical protein MiSe_07390 [Microseira wollei NIES-4236]
MGQARRLPHKAKKTLVGWAYSSLHSDEVHLGLCSGTLKGAATQTKPKGFTSLVRLKSERKMQEV